MLVEDERLVAGAADVGMRHRGGRVSWFGGWNWVDHWQGTRNG